MGKNGDAPGLNNKRLLRLGLLVLSTLSILVASAFAYDRVVYESALNVGSTVGGATGPGSTTSPGANSAPATIILLAVLGLVVGLSIFGLLRKMPRHVGETAGKRESPSETPASTHSGEEEVDESQKKEEPVGIDDEILIAMMNSKRRESETAE